mmetsp:Transcript_67889/g.189568  ORF Transcript_67889/g.189568 Transcript_67889/m.189568 type:complete len:209 (+) Transcript_67889:150-776(+)
MVELLLGAPVKPMKKWGGALLPPPPATLPRPPPAAVLFSAVVLIKLPVVVARTSRRCGGGCCFDARRCGTCCCGCSFCCCGANAEPMFWSCCNTQAAKLLSASIAASTSVFSHGGHFVGRAPDAAGVRLLIPQAPPPPPESSVHCVFTWSSEEPRCNCWCTFAGRRPAESCRRAPVLLLIVRHVSDGDNASSTDVFKPVASGLAVLFT